MPLGTVDRTPPPFFKQGTPARTKLWLLSALAVLLMVVDARLQWAAPVRSALALALTPVQWVVLQPVRALQWAGHYFTTLEAAQRDAQEARALLMQQAERAGLVEYLAQENRALRRLLQLRERSAPTALAAEVLHVLPDPYVPGVVIDRGRLHGVSLGAPVLDGFGVLGQVTRVYPATSEVTLLIHRQLAVPVLNTRTGERHLAYGTGQREVPALALRFVPLHTPTEVGDVLVTSGLDGVYPPGLPVGTISHVGTAGGEGFADVQAQPAARVGDAQHVLVLRLPSTDGQPPAPESRP
ncbi:rod shape-determining protein MreC [Tepidimonas charontis]|uniref:Cell shape-determining protein MreC n=1 Tax=Tepidimonas charontis TaxID=2267262 RepID=A0A554XDE1_9BURK|nr:rod shape-determining protein MreC [Tepidimonas charontis]TSE33848.1 Cell shape-determining protein MreC [Tepidimonas charontis]